MMKYLLAFVLLCSPVEAGTLQYQVDTLQVTGYTADGVFDADPSHSTLTVGAEPAWSVPSGCPVDGRAPWKWSRVVTVNPLVIELNPSFLFFHCIEVHSPDEVQAVVIRELTALIASGNPLTAILGTINIASLGLCPAHLTDPDPDCDTIRADMVTMNNVQPGQKTQFHGFVSTLVQPLLDEMTTFIGANFP